MLIASERRDNGRSKSDFIYSYYLKIFFTSSDISISITPTSDSEPKLLNTNAYI
jgi:hypothetical protein